MKTDPVAAPLLKAAMTAQTHAPIMEPELRDVTAPTTKRPCRSSPLASRLQMACVVAGWAANSTAATAPTLVAESHPSALTIGMMPRHTPRCSNRFTVT